MSPRHSSTPHAQMAGRCLARFASGLTLAIALAFGAAACVACVPALSGSGAAPAANSETELRMGMIRPENVFIKITKF